MVAAVQTQGTSAARRCTALRQQFKHRRLSTLSRWPLPALWRQQDAEDSSGVLPVFCRARSGLAMHATSFKTPQNPAEFPNPCSTVECTEQTFGGGSRRRVHAQQGTHNREGGCTPSMRRVQATAQQRCGISLCIVPELLFKKTCP